MAGTRGGRTRNYVVRVVKQHLPRRACDRGHASERRENAKKEHRDESSSSRQPLARAGAGRRVRTRSEVYKAAPRRGASAAPPDREAWRNQRPAPGPAAEVRFPAPEVAKLPNGMTLYVVRRPAAVVTMRLVVRHGASAVPEGKSGLAALTARMLTEGTRKRSSQALAEAAESLGSSLEADASRDDSLVGISSLVADVDKAVELLAEVVTSPTFDAKEFERVRAEWLDKLVGERQAPERLAALADCDC